jgi:two-component system, sensor histidine kinase and response regulator
MSSTPASEKNIQTILIVDDTPANLAVVVECLEGHGFRVVIAQDGEEGLRRAELVQPDLILLDVVMPRLDGFETCRRLKSLPGTRDIPVIFMTALAETREKVTGFKVGGLDYVTKPLQVDEVFARVSTHLNLRAMQKKLEVQNAQLQQEILERRQAEAALMELMQGVKNVSHSIAHDLRTPLGELRSRLEDLSMTRPPTDETFSEIDGAIADVDRVMGIFNALLRLAEIDSGARRSGFAPVDVAKVAGDAAEFYQPLAEDKGLTLSFESSGELTAAGDATLLEQAIANLLENALKYANGTIAVTATQRRNDEIEIAVSDDGPGIPDEEKPRVKERFYRSNASRGMPGVGLGLSLVAAIARLHGGALELSDNHPGLRAGLLLSCLQPSNQSQATPRLVEQHIDAGHTP